MIVHVKEQIVPEIGDFHRNCRVVKETSKPDVRFLWL
jgi:hypothetical protein